MREPLPHCFKKCAIKMRRCNIFQLKIMGTIYVRLIIELEKKCEFCNLSN